MKICYGSYNRQVPVDKREAFAKMFAAKLSRGIAEMTGEETDVVCCAEREEITHQIRDGCDVIITECQLRLPPGGKPGEDNVGYGTVKEWTAMPGVHRVILLVQPGDKPQLGEKDGKETFIAGRKLVELFRRGYYDGLFYNDLTVDQIVRLSSAGRTENEAKAYYGITDRMLEILLLGSGAKETGAGGSEEKKSLLGGLFGGKKKSEETMGETNTSGSAEEKEMLSASTAVRIENPPQSNKAIKDSREKQVNKVEKKRMEKEEKQASGEVFKALLASGTDAVFEEEEAAGVKEEIPDGFVFTKPQDNEDGYDRPNVPYTGTEDTMEHMDSLFHKEGIDDPIFEQKASENTEPVMGESGGLVNRMGKISSCLNGGTLLAVDLSNLPADSDVATYGVTVLIKGTEEGRVVNGRWQSSFVAFNGYCVKAIMQRTLLIEVPDSEVQGMNLSGKSCMVTFNKLQ